MPDFQYKTWGGAREIINADLVTFEPGHVVFWHKTPGFGPNKIVRAVQNVNVNDLHEVINSGS